MALALPISFIFDLMAFAAIYIILCASLNLQFGLGGISNFGLVLGVAAGAFTAGGVSGRIAQWMFNVMPGADFVQQNSPIMSQVNDLLRADPFPGFGIMAITLILAMLVGAGVGYLSALPSIKLRDDYLAITLLAFGETFRIIGDRYDPIVGGALGVAVVDPFGFLDVWRFPAVTLLILAFASLTVVYLVRIGASPLGRTLRALRDSDLSAQTLGKDTARVRIRTIMIGTAIAALGGALYVYYTVAVTAITFTRVNWVFWPWLMLILGGPGNSKGVVFGASSVIVVRAVINLTKQYLTTYVPFDPAWMEYLAFGVVLLVILTYRPRGVFAERPGSTVEIKFIRKLLSERSAQKRRAE